MKLFYKKGTLSVIKKCLLAVSVLIVGVVVWDSARIARYHFWFERTLLTLPLTPEKDKELKHIFSQPFFYLDEGATSRVFVSEDRHSVIKFFIKKKQKSKSRSYIPVLNRLAAYRKALRLQFQLYRSCLNAHGLLSESTASIYYHLEPTAHFNQTLKLFDKEGSVSFLDLDKESYYLQKRAVVAGDYIKTCILSGDIDNACTAISNLLAFSFSLYRQGIILDDLYPKNFGFINHVPIRIDIEHVCFKKASKKKCERYYKTDLPRLRKWVARNCPEDILTFFDLEVQNLFKIGD